ncbi:MAG: peptide deformylase [Patescibacteria group bacterium]|nr:peptide deformylase [Patescibacteria group bacterium]MDQ5971008.1 peptide deformylase [Patescibacteria group bacterium]
MLKIVKYPDPFLRRTAKKVTDFNDDLKKVVLEMVEAMYQDDGIGLAAPQVGISQRFLVIGKGDNKSHEVYINPEITFFSKNKELGEEGCLSLPQIFGLVRRAKKIHVKYQDINGLTQKVKLSGLDAIVLQHELDHLDGILFIDRAEEITKGQDILDSLKP